MKSFATICLTLALSALLITGCSPNNCTVAPAPEATESTPPPSESAQLPGQTAPSEPTGPTADEQAAVFVAALQAGDIDTLKRVSNPMFTDEMGFEARWATVKLNGVTYAPIEVQEQNGLYALTLDVADAGATSLETGKHEYVMSVGYPAFGETAMVLSIIPKEKFTKFDDDAADAVIVQVNLMRQWGLDQSFASPADIDRDILIDYLIIVASHTDNPQEPNYELTQAMIDAAAKQYFGMDSFVHTTSKFYNKEKQVYELSGRCGKWLNERVVHKEVDAQTGGVAVYVETYQDSLQVAVDKTMKYTLSPNGDGTYRFVSAVEVEAL